MGDAPSLVPAGGRRGLRFSGALPVLVLLLVLEGCAGGGGGGLRDGFELTNPRLGPAYAQWLVGAAGALATDQEIREYMALDSDFAAVDFVEDFWARRDPDPDEPGNPVRQTFEARQAEADRRFGEGGVSGRKTPRGVVFVLCGEAESTDYEIPRPGGPSVEVWFYDPDTVRCLDGSRPAGSYRFQKLGEVTGVYRPGGPPVRPPVD